MIELKDVGKSFGDYRVLKGVSVLFEKGKTNLIIGQSGSGKTVLLKTIVGLFDKDEGEIFYDNRPLSHMSIYQKRDLRKEMGMLFQGGALFDSYTVEENVLFPLEMFSTMSPEERMERVNFCLKKVNLINANHLYPSEISGGMQKRVAIARAIAQNPQYLFCDEPNSGLDPKTSMIIDELIYELTQEFNMTTVVNTHDMNSVTQIGDKIIFLFDGEKCWEGTKNEIFRSGSQKLDDFIFATNLMKKIKST